MQPLETTALAGIVLAGLAVFFAVWLFSFGLIQQAIAALSGEDLSATEEREP